MTVRIPLPLLCLFFGLAAVTVRLSGQVAAPAAATPENPPAGASAAAAPAAPANAAAPATGHVLRYILIADSVDEALKLTPPPEGGYVAVSPGLQGFNLAELTKRLDGGQGRVIEERLLAVIAQVVEVFLRQSEFPAATAIIPTQKIDQGAIRVLVTLGERSTAAPVPTPTEWKIRNITMQGTRWFSESLLREKLRIEQGGTVRFSELDSAISWTNNNPFRRVRVHMQPVSATTAEADVTVMVQDAIPLRLVAMVDNSGNDLIGRNRYTGSISYANMWGKDHQASYQYITTNKPEYFQAHGFDYRAPLPWRHYLQFSASYLKAKPELIPGFLQQVGETVTADLRYTAPLRTGDNAVEAYAAINFKESNNNLTWDPRADNIQILANKTDVFQLTLGAMASRRDKRGVWAFGGSVVYSPGGINSRNTDAAFDAARHGGSDSARLGAEASYFYGNLSLQRLTNLGAGWDWIARGVGQLSVANLLSSEQLAIGGVSTVRGFNEGTFAGDHGYVISNELLAPSWKQPLPYISKHRGPLETRFLAFIDFGHTAARVRYNFDPPRRALAGAGLGARMQLANNFSFTADYGWQLTDLPYVVDRRSRASLRATIGF